MILIYIDDWVDFSMEDRYSYVELEYILVVYNQQFLETIPDLDDIHFGMYALDCFQSLKNVIANLLQLSSTNIKLVWNHVILQDHETPYAGIKK